MHAIEIDHLTYSYPGAAHPALQDITVCVEQGDFLAIVGNNVFYSTTADSTPLYVLDGGTPVAVTRGGESVPTGRG